MGAGPTNLRPHTLQDMLDEGRLTLAGAGCEGPARDARILARHAFAISDIDMITDGTRAVTDEAAAQYRALITRRANGEPVSRIIGRREFWGLEFAVTPAVLDPRPDTETIIESVLARMRDKPPATILDLGTGTGCILISLLREFPEAQGVAVDLSAAALDVARLNAATHGVDGRIMFINGSWFDQLAGRRFDLIVSNPPYIPNPVIESLDVEVRNHDPILALVGGEDGYEAYRAILKDIKNHMTPDARAYFEVGYDQGENVARLAGESNLSVAAIIPDIAGIPRVVEICCGDK